MRSVQGVVRREDKLLGILWRSAIVADAAGNRAVVGGRVDRRGGRELRRSTMRGTGGSGGGGGKGTRSRSCRRCGSRSSRSRREHVLLWLIFVHDSR